MDDALWLNWPGTGLRYLAIFSFQIKKKSQNLAGLTSRQDSNLKENLLRWVKGAFLF